ncbi:transmembrane emp24 domain-containing protein bai [Diaphorina citri]|uniref:Transmembrane emp24 domain-containing protein bai n=1 Tax=Diaphorina citri TaxID=121845 RepID=A0A1S4EL48_DIACI|nr:transmembrane emp24 domain-containing protein bai [Diaphorina citri]KAI5706250.1 hypothetical protein M8J75_006322 [Diaphorina citri]KAI5740572.1 hypothetical protein M8J76_005199 [Diaphorina citri]KAI5747443.1 hypothetical protein M8J77_014621 [Diaphorina citri]
MRSLYLSAGLVLLYTACVHGIMWHLEPNTRKCLREELGQNVLIAGEYEVSELPGQRVDYQITDSKNHILSRGESVTKGKFTFVTETYDTVEICFISMVPPGHPGRPHEVSLLAKQGVEAKNYEGMGEAAKLKPLEIELKKLEDLSSAVVEDFVQMRKREEEMRDTNESTNNRVLYFSIFSMFCLLSLATWQVLYLRNFFKTKKLIE